MLNEIGLTRSLSVIRWAGIILNNVFQRICSAVYVNEDSIQRLKNSIGTTPVLYLPSHRSYMDFVLMSYICFAYDLEIPGIAAGMGKFHAVNFILLLNNIGPYYSQISMQWSVSECCCAKLVRFSCDAHLPTTNCIGTFSKSTCVHWSTFTIRALSSSSRERVAVVAKHCHRKSDCCPWH